MKAIHRLYEYLEYKGIKPTNFETQMGFSSGYLSSSRKRNADLGESVLVKIIDYCHDLDEVWFVTGRGKMIKEESKALEESKPIQVAKEPFQSYGQDYSKELLRLNVECNEKGNKIIALLEENATLRNENLALKSQDGAQSHSA